ncbi:dihydrodipicolinate synthase family protein [Nocardia sp. CA-290969]|uniref:dihydrodipicolinate synthase family protein n=1 Tax=Nocardia sp. CA-290969 TaxID=3239986 RepID=UPI003D919396
MADEMGSEPGPRWAGAAGLNPVLATITPFTSDLRVDTGALGDYLAFLHESGAQAILVNGTTGEFPALTVAERKTVLEFTRARWPGQVVAHIGTTAVGDAIELLDHAQSHADAVAAIAPYYFAEPPEAGIREYFGTLLGRTKVPLLVYNFPRHTQVAITPGFLSSLAVVYPMLAGVKDSGADRGITRAYAIPGLSVFVGSDGAAAHIGEFGAQGIVSGGGNPVPELPVRIAEALRAGDNAAALRWQSVLDECRELRRRSGLTDVAFVKAALTERLPGFPAAVRPPLVAADPEQTRDIRTYLRERILPRIHENGS